MYEASKLKAVWVAALERECRSHEIFKPTYPTEKMSILDLEHAALAPYRMIKLLKAKNLEVPVEPYQTRIFRCRESNTNAVYGRHHPRGIRIVPGGRFVFTYDVENLHLWDLGYNVNIPIRPSQTAIVNIKHRKIIAIGASRDGEVVILAFDAG